MSAAMNYELLSSEELIKTFTEKLESNKKQKAELAELEAKKSELKLKNDELTKSVNEISAKLHNLDEAISIMRRYICNETNRLDSESAMNEDKIRICRGYIVVLEGNIAGNEELLGRSKETERVKRGEASALSVIYDKLSPAAASE